MDQDVRRKIVTAITFALTMTFLPLANNAEAKVSKIGGKKNKCLTFEKGHGWKGYLHDEDGRDCSLPDPIEKLKDRDWMFLRFTEYKGPKPTLAVMPVDDRSGTGDEDLDGISTLIRILSKGAGVAQGQNSRLPLDGLEVMLSTALFNTNRFVMVERDTLETVFDEQDFGTSDRVSQPTAPKIGKILGADYLIHATVVEWIPEKNKIGGSGGRSYYWKKLSPSASVGRSTAEVAISFKVVDSTNASILHSVTTRAEAKNWTFGAGLFKNFGFLGNNFGNLGISKGSPISYAVQAAISKASYELANFLKQRPWRGSVVRVQDNLLVVNAGSNRGIQSSMVLTVLHKGEELTDPETGLVLDAQTKVIGTAQVTSVQEKYAEAVILDGCDGVKRGDRVEILDNTLAWQSAPSASKASAP